MQFRAKRKQALDISHRVPKRYRWGESHQCYWCGRHLRYGLLYINQPDQATRDHLVPRSVGGFGGDWNIVAACRACNSHRGSSMEWLPFNQRRGVA